jgi:Putative zinc dependent peptidase (DUF5700)
LDGELDDESYERAIAPFTGNGWHVVGATMFDAIDRATGRTSVIEAMQDPRESRVAGGVGNLLPVDLWVPRCPPHPFHRAGRLARLLGAIESGKRDDP